MDLKGLNDIHRLAIFLIRVSVHVTDRSRVFRLRNLPDFSTLSVYFRISKIALVILEHTRISPTDLFLEILQ